MKVYLVDVDNGASYEDYRHSVDAVFTTYRGASQWLMNQGYKPFHDRNYKNEDELRFHWQESDEYMAVCSDAIIIEMEVME